MHVVALVDPDTGQDSVRLPWGKVVPKTEYEACKADFEREWKFIKEQNRLKNMYDHRHKQRKVIQSRQSQPEKKRRGQRPIEVVVREGLRGSAPGAFKASGPAPPPITFPVGGPVINIQSS